MKTIEKKEYLLARDPAEKRRATRYPFSPAVEAVDLRANLRIAGRLSDIASRGCYMDTICPFAAKSAVALTITKDDQSFKVQAEVVYSQIGMGMGLFFTRAEPDQLRLLEKWLTELRGAAVPEPHETTESNQPGLAAIAEFGKSLDDELREVLSDLVTLLGRKNIMDESEEKAMLQKLSK